MSPRHGIVVHPGTAIDFSILARPKTSTSNLLSRATKKKTNAGGIVFIIILVIVVISLIFCAVVFILILKNQRKKRARQRQLEESRPMVAHEYRQLDDMESTRGPQELPSEGQLHGNSPAQRAEIDGYAVAPHVNTLNQPVELPPNAHTVAPPNK